MQQHSFIAQPLFLFWTFSFSLMNTLNSLNDLVVTVAPSTTIDVTVEKHIEYN